ncbi:enoyl-CoA hydratase [Nitratireductor mangrovi]|uniref:Enoyl-CoA hydratase n=2 Tax=Nitratireductor mangrovi TaxID=2599600 RepID=A0A5B8L604_9HYPH|nr:enoyl-CoA hydratase [Nitratireductor mangrovi]
MAGIQAGAETALAVSRDDDGVVAVTFNRPAKKNALTLAMWRALTNVFAALEQDNAARVVILRGAGTDFCAGADISEFGVVRRDAGTARDYEAANSAAFAAIRNSRLPTIAAISGTCFGGGFGIAAACDIRLATADARFSVPAARLGLAYPAEAMTDIVAATGPQMAKYLLFSAARLDAGDVLRAGFLLEVVEDAEALWQRCNATARDIAANAPLTIRASKAAIVATFSRDIGDIERARALGDATFDSADYAEGRTAFAERRRPRFKGI